MSQLRSDELHGQEGEVARAEVELAGRETALAGKEIELEARLSGERSRLNALEEKLLALAQAGSEEADAFLHRLPDLPPAPGYSDRLKALAARSEAVKARSVSVAAREKAFGILSAGLARSDGSLGAAEAEGNRIEAAFAALKRKQAEERRAQAARPPPPPAAVPQVPPALIPVAAVAAATPLTPPLTPVGRMEAPRLAPAAPRPAKADKKPGPRQRTRLDCDVSFESESNFFEGFARNLSEGGLFVAAWDYLPVGTEMDVAFSLPEFPRIEARAVVRWVRELNDATPDVWPGMGLQFTSLPAGAEEAIRKFMVAREPLFFPD